MCLTVNLAKTQKAKRSKVNEVTRYKVVHIRHDTTGDLDIHSWYQGSYKWHIGDNKAMAHRVGTTNEHAVKKPAKLRDGQSISPGIHVFTTLAAAKRFIGGRPNANEAIVRVRCKRDDLIACSTNNEETFTKVELPAEEYFATLALFGQCVIKNLMKDTTGTALAKGLAG